MRVLSARALLERLPWAWPFMGAMDQSSTPAHPPRQPKRTCIRAASAGALPELPRAAATSTANIGVKSVAGQSGMPHASRPQPLCALEAPGRCVSSRYEHSQFQAALYGVHPGAASL